jgi:hypothetical protein
MIDFEKNDIFDSFRLTLEQAKLINFGKEDRIIIPDKRQFLEFGFGLYLLWINVHKRTRTPFLYFTGVGTDQTLFLVSPYQDNPFFLSNSSIILDFSSILNLMDYFGRIWIIID